MGCRPVVDLDCSRLEGRVRKNIIKGEAGYLKNFLIFIVLYSFVHFFLLVSVEKQGELGNQAKMVSVGNSRKRYLDLMESVCLLCQRGK